MGSSKLLIVEDNAAFGRTLMSALAERFEDLRLASSVAEARAEIQAFAPDVILLDVCLPDGGAIDVIAASGAMIPIPAIVAMSAKAGPEESFLLAQRGVRAYLQKPFALAKLEAALELAVAPASGVEPLLQPTGSDLGRLSLPEIEERNRRALVEGALTRGQGRVSAAARILGISRQALQHILRRQRGE